jgi:hypothetical protein
VDLPPVTIVNAVIDNVNTVDLAGRSDLVVPPGTKNLLINFTSLYFSHPAKVRFEYMLEGFDSRWNSAPADRMVNYTNITPGVYKFLVKSYLADTPESYSETSMRLEIRAVLLSGQQIQGNCRNNSPSYDSCGIQSEDQDPQDERKGASETG